VSFIHLIVHDLFRTGIRRLPKPRIDGPQFKIPPGHHLIACACLTANRQHQPHPCLPRIARNIFLYFRECERDRDAHSALCSYDRNKWHVDPDPRRNQWSGSVLTKELTDRFLRLLDHDHQPFQRHEFLQLFIDELLRRQGEDGQDHCPTPGKGPFER
jgi:hypothetical protein